MNAALPIVIAGGGIAGLSAAIALARRGFSVVVCEKRGDAVEAGAGLQLSPNASHILLRWGLGPDLSKHAVAPKELAIRRWEQPRAFARMPFDERSKAPLEAAPFWVTMRADLHSALKSAATRLPTITLHNGVALERVQQHGSHVNLRFMSADKTIDMDALCLIGADGQRSTARRLLGDARDLDRPGFEAWRTVIPAAATSDFARAATTNLWLGRECHAVHYPIAGGRSINLVFIRRSQKSENDWKLADSWARDGDIGELGAHISNAAEPLRELMQAAPSWKVWTLLDRAPSPYIAKDLCALVGDAAHPVLPFLAQGAAMAIEDAEVLASAMPLAQHASPEAVRAALKSYAARRAPRVARVFKAARSNAFAYHLPASLAWARDWRMAQLGPDGMRQRYSWLYDWRADTSEA